MSGVLSPLLVYPRGPTNRGVCFIESVFLHIGGIKTFPFLTLQHRRNTQNIKSWTQKGLKKPYVVSELHGLRDRIW